MPLLGVFSSDSKTVDIAGNFLSFVVRKGQGKMTMTNMIVFQYGISSTNEMMMMMINK